MKATCSTSVITSSGSPSRGETQPLDLPVSSLRGAGPVTAARLAARGIVTARDLLFRLPRGFDDLRRVTPIAELDRVEDGTVVLVRGTVQKLRLFPRRVLDVFVADGGAVVRARW